MTAPKRRNPKRDANELPIVDCLKKLGATVERLHTPVDLLIGVNGRTALGEVKTDGGKLTVRQEEFIRNWRGDTVWILTTTDDAIELVNAMRSAA